MDFENFLGDVNYLNTESNEDIKKVVERINITPENFNSWVQNIFSEKILELNLDKLPYVIDELYKTTDKLKFMLCCMLLESTCTDLPFITNLEDYPLFKEKYEAFKHTLITVYDSVDNGIANCMALIMLNTDPYFKLLNEDEKTQLIVSTRKKLNQIIVYLKTTKEIDNSIYKDLELLIDLASHMNDQEIRKEIEKINLLPLDYSCKLFIAKYKLVNHINIKPEEIEELLENKNQLENVISIFEHNGGIDKLPLNRITQEDIARSAMIHWLVYPTELGKIPDDIQLLGELEFDGYVYYVYKFRSTDFRIKDYMLGVSGGYKKDIITSSSTGITFSKFEVVSSDFMEQAREIIEFITNYWRNRK